MLCTRGGEGGSPGRGWCVVYICILCLYIQTDGNTEHHGESSSYMNLSRIRFLSCTLYRGVRLYSRMFVVLDYRNG